MLYQQFLPGIFGYMATRVPDRGTAEDLTSDVFVQMIEGIHNLRATNEAGFAAWLLRIAHAVVAGYYRKREKQPPQVSIPTENWKKASQARRSSYLTAILRLILSGRLRHVKNGWMS